MRRQNTYSCILVLSTAFIAIILVLLYSTNSYLNQKGLARVDDTGNIVKASSGILSTRTLYPSLADPKTSPQNPSGVKKGVETGTSPSNPTNTGESLIGSFLNPKILLSSAIDQIRNSTTNSVTSNRKSTIVVWDYDTVLLSRQIIPPKDFIPLFDALPYQVMNGYVSAKLPCSANSTSSLKIFMSKISVGQTPELRPIPLQIVAQLSKPPSMCVYHAEIPSTAANSNETKRNDTRTPIPGAADNLTTTHIELFNPTSSQVILPDTSSAAIGFNETFPPHDDYRYNRR